MPEFIINPDAPLLIEAATAATPGEELTSNRRIQQIAEQSEDAINHALSTIYNMACGLHQTVNQMKLAERPSEVEMEFGLILNAEGGHALIAKAGVEAGIKVKLKWQRREDGSDA